MVLACQTLQEPIIEDLLDLEGLLSLSATSNTFSHLWRSVFNLYFIYAEEIIQLLLRAPLLK